MSEKSSPTEAWAVGECAKASVRNGDRRLCAVLRALLVGVVFAVALSLAATVAYAILEQRLREQEAKLAELLARFGGAQPAEHDELNLQRQQPPDLSVSLHRRDAMLPVGSNRRPMLRSPDIIRNVVRRAADPMPGQHSTQLVIKANKYNTISSGFERLGYIEWDVNSFTEAYSLIDDKWLRVDVGGLYYVYSQVTWRAPSTGLTSTNLHPSTTLQETLLHRIEMKTPKSGELHRQRHAYDVSTLAVGSVTLCSSRCRRSIIECPSQSSYTGGVFSLASGTLLAVSANASVPLTEKTFFGMFLLRSH